MVLFVKNVKTINFVTAKIYTIENVLNVDMMKVQQPELYWKR